MRGIKKTVYEWYLVVEGRGGFPLDMLRYDACFPYEQTDSNRIERHDRRRIAFVRRGVNEGTGTAARWESFGWKVILATTDPKEARDLADGLIAEPSQPPQPQ